MRVAEVTLPERLHVSNSRSATLLCKTSTSMCQRAEKVMDAYISSGTTLCTDCHNEMYPLGLDGDGEKLYDLEHPTQYSCTRLDFQKAFLAKQEHKES